MSKFAQLRNKEQGFGTVLKTTMPVEVYSRPREAQRFPGVEGYGERTTLGGFIQQVRDQFQRGRGQT